MRKGCALDESVNVATIEARASEAVRTEPFGDP
jgi:hypothetical protein